MRFKTVRTALRSYRGLKVWQASVELAEETYRVCRAFPASERFGLASQMRRAAVSIPANIAEGYGRAHRGDYLRSLSVANGSLKEWETEMIVAGRIGLVTAEDLRRLMALSDEVGRMLGSLTRSLRRQPLHPTPSHPTPS